MTREQKVKKLRQIFTLLQQSMPDKKEEFWDYLVLLETFTEEQSSVVDEWFRLVGVMMEGVDIETQVKLKKLLNDIRESQYDKEGIDCLLQEL